MVEKLEFLKRSKNLFSPSPNFFRPNKKLDGNMKINRAITLNNPVATDLHLVLILAFNSHLDLTEINNDYFSSNESNSKSFAT